MKDKKVINSPIRWAGSKKKILNEMLELFKHGKKNYIECFLGSSIVLINVLKYNNELKYERFYVNDINPYIINFYKLLKNKPNYIINKIYEIIENYNNLSQKEQEEFYYYLRNCFNNEKNTNKKSAYFFFLMKAGFNGVYRENKAHHFNVPFGRKTRLSVDFKNLKEISELIQPVEFYNLDYNDFLDEMKNKKIIDDSFIYFDPPYIPEDNARIQKQELYTCGEFDHISFYKKVNSLNFKYAMISMSDSVKATQIYNRDGFNKNSLKEILRTINPQKIFPSKEVVFTNYEIDIDKRD